MSDDNGATFAGITVNDGIGATTTFASPANGYVLRFDARTGAVLGSPAFLTVTDTTTDANFLLAVAPLPGANGVTVAGEYNSAATIVGSDGVALPALPNFPSTQSLGTPTNEDVLLTRLDRQLRGVWATRVSGPNDDLSGGITSTGAGSASAGDAGATTRAVAGAKPQPNGEMA